MQTALRFLLLLTHSAVSAVLMYYIEDLMSQPIDMGSLLALGLALSLVMISIIKHTGNFLLFIKNKKPQL